MSYFKTVCVRRPCVLGDFTNTYTDQAVQGSDLIYVHFYLHTDLPKGCAVIVHIRQVL